MFKKSAFFVIIIFTGINLVWAQGIKDKFKDNDTLAYKVSFNGMRVGVIEWKYLGQGKVEEKPVDILSVTSDTKILSLFDMTSSERVYLDSQTHLPLKVERDLVVSGKNEIIKEMYDQDRGQVRIIRKGKNAGEEIYNPGKPIHNILDLLYFFPKSLELDPAKWMHFNLPTQTIRIKFIRERKLKINRKVEDTYFLLGRGSKRISLWMDKENRLPLRIEFIFPIGKVVITRKPK
jgi:hypothetical protein